MALRQRDKKYELLERRVALRGAIPEACAIVSQRQAAALVVRVKQVGCELLTQAETGLRDGIPVFHAGAVAPRYQALKPLAHSSGPLLLNLGSVDQRGVTKATRRHTSITDQIDHGPELPGPCTKRP